MDQDHGYSHNQSNSSSNNPENPEPKEPQMFSFRQSKIINALDWLKSMLPLAEIFDVKNDMSTLLECTVYYIDAIHRYMNKNYPNMLDGIRNKFKIDVNEYYSNLQVNSSGKSSSNKTSTSRKAPSSSTINPFKNTSKKSKRQNADNLDGLKSMSKIRKLQPNLPQKFDFYNVDHLDSSNLTDESLRSSSVLKSKKIEKFEKIEKFPTFQKNLKKTPISKSLKKVFPAKLSPVLPSGLPENLKPINLTENGSTSLCYYKTFWDESFSSYQDMCKNTTYDLSETGILLDDHDQERPNTLCLSQEIKSKDQTDHSSDPLKNNSDTSGHYSSNLSNISDSNLTNVTDCIGSVGCHGGGGTLNLKRKMEEEGIGVVNEDEGL